LHPPSPDEDFPRACVRAQGAIRMINLLECLSEDHPVRRV
jgi:hypothetical protein